MKKFLALFLALLMCVGVFASCVKKDGETTVTLEQAKDYLYNVMKDKNGKEIPNDYDVVGKIIIENVSFDVTWTTDNENIKIKASSKANMWTVDLPETNAAVIEYKLTATIKAADGSTIEISFTPKLPAFDKTGIVTDPVAGVAYKLFFTQVNLGRTYYAMNTTQDNKNKYVNACLDPKEAADFYVEVVDGGYKIYTEIEGVKNYLHATATPKTDGGTGFTKTIGFATTTDTVFAFDSELSTFYVQMSGEKFGVGTYGQYETICISELAKHFKTDNINVKDGQFPMGFMTSAYAETLEPDVIPPHVHNYVDGICECGEVDPNRPAGNYAPILNKATLQAANPYADRTVTVEGVEFQYTELGYFGTGVQWRSKNGKTSTLWNNTATPSAIEKIEITLADGKAGFDNTDALKIDFGTAKDSLTYNTTMSTVKDQYIYTITPDADNYTFFKITLNITYTVYIERISIVYVGGAAHEHEFVNGECACGEKDPNSGSGSNPSGTNAVTTIAEAMTAPVGTNVVLTGIVIAPEAWSDQYSNMCFTLKDETGATIYVFRIGTLVGLGDKVTVTGVVGDYNGINQIAQGATAEILVVHGDNHTYTNDICTVCGSAKPVAGETIVKCDFSTLAVGTQYADESNAFGDVITVSTHNQKCHFNTQLRIYTGGYAVITSTKTITALALNAGYKDTDFNVYASVNGTDWVLVETLAVKSAYGDFTVDIDENAGYKYVKLETTELQVRVKSVNVTVVD